MDARRFGGAAQEMKVALEGKLFAVVTDDENAAQLDECFREARELVDSASALLGCPQSTRERLAFVFMTVGTTGVISSLDRTSLVRGFRLRGSVGSGSRMLSKYS